MIKTASNKTDKISKELAQRFIEASMEARKATGLRRIPKPVK